MRRPGPILEPRDGEVLARWIYFSLDPYMRGRINGVRSYVKPVDVEAGLGFAVYIDHHAEDFGAALDRACPNGVNVYWENVGGAMQS